MHFNDDTAIYEYDYFLEQKGSSSDEETTKDEEKTKPSDEVQIDSKLSDFFKVCTSKCFECL
jgi:hypothetical protein